MILKQSLIITLYTENIAVVHKQLFRESKIRVQGNDLRRSKLQVYMEVLDALVSYGAMI